MPELRDEVTRLRREMAVFNETGAQAAALSSDENGGALVLFDDDDGQPHLSLPLATTDRAEE